MSGGKTAVILGATGFVGQGAALAFLRQGWTVVLVGREMPKLEALTDTLTSMKGTDNFEGRIKHALGHFDSDEMAQHALAHVKKSIGGDGTFDHVLSILGFATTMPTPPTETPSEKLEDIIANEFMPTYRAAGAFLKEIKGRAGASYTIVSGGLAHGVFFPAAWTATIKNSLINTFCVTLAAETKESPVRTNCACIHFGVTSFGGQKNQFGMPGTDTEKLGPVFVGLANGKKKGELVCLTSFEDAQKLLAGGL